MTSVRGNAVVRKGSGSCRITSVAMLNALGSSRGEIERKLFGGFADDLRPHAWKLDGGPVLVGAVEAELPPLPPALARHDSRLARMLQAVLRDMAPDIGALRARHAPERIGIVLGSSTSGIEAAENAFIAARDGGTFPASYHYEQQELGAPSEIVRSLTGFTGPCYTISTACSSSAKVFGAAERLIRRGICDAVIAGGADTLCRLTVRGFDSLELIAPERSNPSSVNRCGLNLGEGAALAILENAEGGVQVLGVGEASDAYHISTPHPEGRGAAEAMRRALGRAGLDPGRIRYVNLHGTGTIHNDAMEAKALASVFGTEIPICSSTKPFTGHLLGAAGATEIGFCWFALDRASRAKPLPAHVWDGKHDPALPRMEFASEGVTLDIASGEAMLSSSFAFGGSNCAVILGAAT